MASPDRPDEGHIADTGMFKRFVAEEQQREEQEHAGIPRWVLPVIMLVLIVAAIVVWVLVR